jgi:hypothetical protein
MNFLGGFGPSLAYDDFLQTAVAFAKSGGGGGQSKQFIATSCSGVRLVHLMITIGEAEWCTHKW